MVKLSFFYLCKTGQKKSYQTVPPWNGLIWEDIGGSGGVRELTRHERVRPRARPKSSHPLPFLSPARQANAATVEHFLKRNMDSRFLLCHQAEVPEIRKANGLP